MSYYSGSSINIIEPSYLELGVVLGEGANAGNRTNFKS